MALTVNRRKRLFLPLTVKSFKLFQISLFRLILTDFWSGGGEGVLPYMGYIGMCRCEGYGFQAVYSRIGYINQNIWVSENRETARLG